MKKIKYLFLLIVVLTNSYNLLAQNLFFPKDKFPQQVDSQIEFLKSKFTELAKNHIQLEPIFEKNTKHSKHYTFQILYHDIPIHDASLKVNTRSDGSILSINKEVTLPSDYQENRLLQEQTEWRDINLESFTRELPIPRFTHQTYELVIADKKNESHVYLNYHQHSKTQDETWLINLNAEIVAHQNHLSYLNKDSLIKVKIFNPDPLTSAGQAYGGIFIDNNDANANWMNAEYKFDSIIATYDDINQKFYLENALAKVDDFEAPNIAAVDNTIPEFFYTRNQTGFEDINAFFYITHYHDYISSLGYDTLMNLQLLIDAHGQFNADNSVFNRNGGNPTIIFGVGGIDDAEDADVIIHEYSHGLSWSANYNNNFSLERSGLDEGLADYFATSYSRSINPFNWQKVFNWDGNNGGWNGRLANTSNNYPSNGNIYATGEIWNAAMSNIYSDIGAIITDKLMLESLHFFTNQTSLPEAALYVLQADTILFGGIHSNTICVRFQQKNILDANCKPVSMGEVTKKEKTPQLYNLLGFADGVSDLWIQLPPNEKLHLEVFAVDGKKIPVKSITSSRQIQLSHHDYTSGVYFMTLQIDDQFYRYKIVKH